MMWSLEDTGAFLKDIALCLITGMSGFNSKSSCTKSSCIIEIKVNIILIFHFMLI